MKTFTAIPFNQVKEGITLVEDPEFSLGIRLGVRENRGWQEFIKVNPRRPPLVRVVDGAKRIDYCAIEPFVVQGEARKRYCLEIQRPEKDDRRALVLMKGVSLPYLGEPLKLISGKRVEETEIVEEALWALPPHTSVVVESQFDSTKPQILHFDGEHCRITAPADYRTNILPDLVRTATPELIEIFSQMAMERGHPRLRMTLQTLKTHLSSSYSEL